MTNSYQYSIKVNEALERYGAKTCGDLDRRVARLKRFTTMTNRKYAEEIRLEDARMMAREERQQRVEKRVREILEETEQKEQPRGRICRGPSPKRRVKRNLNVAFQNVADNHEDYRTEDGVSNKWYAVGSPNYRRSARIAARQEPAQEVEIPTTPFVMTTNKPSHSEMNGMELLWTAIQNGFVNTRRGYTSPQ